MSKATLAGLLGLVAAACADGNSGPTAPQPRTALPSEPRFTVTVTQPDGNPSCTQLLPNNPYIREFKLQPEGPPQNGSYTSGDGYLTVTVSGTSSSGFSWTSNQGVDGVLLKSGNGVPGDPSAGSNFYAYDPEATAGSGVTQQSKQISHVTFCYDINLSASKTADPSFNRGYTWQVSKSASPPASNSGDDLSSLTFNRGQTGYDVNYVVGVAGSAADQDWRVSGQVTVANPLNDQAVTVDGLTDNIGATAVTLTDCKVGATAVGVPSPQNVVVLQAGQSLVCSYTQALTSGDPGTNVATASSADAAIGDGVATKPFTFAGLAPSAEYNKCIDVTDTRKGALGSFCAGSGVPASPNATSYTYSIDVASAVSGACGPFTYTNVASYVSQTDAGVTGSTGPVTVSGTVVGCGGTNDGDPGCTLTQGYWKTHSASGPASKPDAGWFATPLTGTLGEKTIFFRSTQTWYQVFRTAPAGDAYYTLAHQWMAAYLNFYAHEASASPTVVTALSNAASWLSAATPSTKLSGPTKAQLTTWAGILAAYNQGTSNDPLNPPHCSEQASN